MHYMPLLAVACLGLVAAVFAWVTVSAWEQRLFRQEFDNIAGDYASLLQNGGAFFGIQAATSRRAR